MAAVLRRERGEVYIVLFLACCSGIAKEIFLSVFQVDKISSTRSGFRDFDIAFMTLVLQC